MRWAGAEDDRCIHANRERSRVVSINADEAGQVSAICCWTGSRWSDQASERAPVALFQRDLALREIDRNRSKRWRDCRGGRSRCHAGRRGDCWGMSPPRRQQRPVRRTPALRCAVSAGDRRRTWADSVIRGDAGSSGHPPKRPAHPRCARRDDGRQLDIMRGSDRRSGLAAWSVRRSRLYADRQARPRGADRRPMSRRKTAVQHPFGR